MKNRDFWSLIEFCRKQKGEGWGGYLGLNLGRKVGRSSWNALFQINLETGCILKAEVYLYPRRGCGESLQSVTPHEAAFIKSADLQLARLRYTHKPRPDPRYMTFEKVLSNPEAAMREAAFLERMNLRQAGNGGIWLGEHYARGIPEEQQHEASVRAKRLNHGDLWKLAEFFRERRQNGWRALLDWGRSERCATRARRWSLRSYIIAEDEVQEPPQAAVTLVELRSASSGRGSHELTPAEKRFVKGFTQIARRLLRGRGYDYGMAVTPGNIRPREPLHIDFRKPFKNTRQALDGVKHEVEFLYHLNPNLLGPVGSSPQAAPEIAGMQHDEGSRG